MNILILTTSFPTKENVNLGGSFIHTEAEAYSKAGIKVTIVTPHVYGTPSKETFGDNISVHRFHYMYPLKFQNIKKENEAIYNNINLLFFLQLPFFLLSFFMAIVRHSKNKDLIHANWTPLAFLALPVQLIRKTPVIMSFRGSDLRIIPGFINRFIFKKVTAVLDIIPGTNRGERIRDLYPGNWVKAPIIVRETKNDPDTKKKINWDTNATHFLFLGRLVELKGVEKGAAILIEAFKDLMQKTTIKGEVYLHIVGDGPLRNEMVLSVEQNHLKKNVIFWGHQNNVGFFLEKCDAVIGGLGLNAVTLEAGFEKKLILMANKKEYIEGIWYDEKNALIFDYDTPKSLSEKMFFFLVNRKLCQEIALLGNKTVRDFARKGREAGMVYREKFKNIICNFNN